MLRVLYALCVDCVRLFCVNGGGCVCCVLCVVCCFYVLCVCVCVCASGVCGASVSVCVGVFMLSLCKSS